MISVLGYAAFKGRVLVGLRFWPGSGQQKSLSISFTFKISIKLEN